MPVVSAGTEYQGSSSNVEEESLEDPRVKSVVLKLILLVKRH